MQSTSDIQHHPHIPALHIANIWHPHVSSMSFPTPPATADVKFEGDPACISLRYTESDAILEWTARSHSGSVHFDSELVGFRTGASTILFHTYKGVPAGCRSRAQRVLKDVLIDFDDGNAHAEWCGAMQGWLERSGEYFEWSPYGIRTKICTKFVRISFERV